MKSTLSSRALLYTMLLQSISDYKRVFNLLTFIKLSLTISSYNLSNYLLKIFAVHGQLIVLSCRVFAVSFANITCCIFLACLIIQTHSLLDNILYSFLHLLFNKVYHSVSVNKNDNNLFSNFYALISNY